MAFLFTLFASPAFAASLSNCNAGVEQFLKQPISRPKSFSAPQKALEPHDLERAGHVIDLNKGPLKPEDIAAAKGRDGVYVFLVTEDNKLVVSHRLPRTDVDPEKDRYLATHRGLYRAAQDSSEQPVRVPMGGEYRVLNGEITGMNNQAGSFHDKLSTLVAENAQSLKGAEREKAAQLAQELAKIEQMAAGKDRNAALESILQDPFSRDLHRSAQSQANDLGKARAALGEAVLRDAGLADERMVKKVMDANGGDGHLSAKVSSLLEIECVRNPECREQVRSMATGFKALTRHLNDAKVEAVRAKSKQYLVSDPEKGMAYYQVYGFLGTIQTDGIYDAVHITQKDPEKWKLIQQTFPKLLEEMGVKAE